MPLDPGRQQPRALHVEDDLRAGVARQHVGRKQHQLPVGEDDLAVLRHHPEAVAVAVEGEAQLAAACLDAGNQVDKVLQVGRVRVMVGKIAVDVAIELLHLAAQRAEQARRDHAGDTVAAVHCDAHGACEIGRASCRERV